MTGLLTAVFLILWLGDAPAPSQPPARVTILADAFGPESGLRKDWGFAALIEHDGLRILFDTGNNSDWFQHNTAALKVDLTAASIAT